MPVSDETDKTPIVLSALSHRFLKQLDARLMDAQEPNGGIYADVAFSLRGMSKPKLFKITIEHLTYKGEC